MVGHLLSKGSFRANCHLRQHILTDRRNALPLYTCLREAAELQTHYCCAFLALCSGHVNLGSCCWIIRFDGLSPSLARVAVPHFQGRSWTRSWPSLSLLYANPATPRRPRAGQRWCLSIALVEGYSLITWS